MRCSPTTNNFEFIDIEREFLGSEYKSYDWPEEYLYTKEGQEESHDWKVVPLYCFGVWNEQNSTTFPKTIELIRTIPGLRTAIFSKLGLETNKALTNIADGADWRIRLFVVIIWALLLQILTPKVKVGLQSRMNFARLKSESGLCSMIDDSKAHIGVNDSLILTRIESFCFLT